MRLLEVCCGDIRSVLNAGRASAERIELCSALELGGLTPSKGLIEKSRKAFGGKIHVLIRPRSGDFIYSRDEVDLMACDIIECARIGVDGVVLGALSADGSVDCGVCGRLIETAKTNGLKVTFHRAFDCSANPEKSLEDVISLGADYLLTSGFCPTAFEGIANLAMLNRQNAGRLKFIAASGVNPVNARQILDATGIDEIHASAREKVERHLADSAGPALKMGISDSDCLLASSSVVIRQIIENIE